MSSSLPVTVSQSRWFSYYQSTSQSDHPWPTLKQAIQVFNEEKEIERIALDLGCGVGNDTAYMVQNNWKVIALDAEKLAKEYLKKKISASMQNQVTFVTSKYEDYSFGKRVKLVNASYALPFCNPNSFNDVMQRMTQAIAVGGRFAGHFLGPKDSWSNDNTMTFLTKEQVLQQFSNGFVIEYFEEKEWKEIRRWEVKHWHVFEVIAKKILPSPL